MLHKIIYIKSPIQITLHDCSDSIYSIKISGDFLSSSSTSSDDSLITDSDSTGSTDSGT